MRKLDTKKFPQPNELWLSRPPYLLIAHIVDVDLRSKPGIVSYELHDEDGCILEHVSHASLDRGWWHAFQPMARNYG
ncbi:MAG TPA: hypothetical protein VG518_03305 [Solirubrobacterales bacterium]|nr:hypothetical protein [Solirubrobacterales bacterium]